MSSITTGRGDQLPRDQRHNNSSLAVLSNSPPSQSHTMRMLEAAADSCNDNTQPRVTDRTSDQKSTILDEQFSGVFTSLVPPPLELPPSTTAYATGASASQLSEENPEEDDRLVH